MRSPIHPNKVRYNFGSIPTALQGSGEESDSLPALHTLCMQISKLKQSLRVRLVKGACNFEQPMCALAFLIPWSVS